MKDLSGGERNRLHLATLLEERRQPAAARRAHERPRRRHPARARRGARQLRRLRGRDQPRPLVPRPHRHPHAGLRGRQPGGLVRGELPGLRGRPASAGSAPTPTSRTGSSTASSRHEKGAGPGRAGPAHGGAARRRQPRPGEAQGLRHRTRPASCRPPGCARSTRSSPPSSAPPRTRSWCTSIAACPRARPSKSWRT